MQLIEAHDADSERLKDFLKSQVQSGHVDLRYFRHGHFFTPYKIQADHFKCYLIEGDDKKVLGSAALTFRKAYIDGKVETIGFAKDLHISKDRRALLQWSQNLLPILEREMKENNCRYFFSAISEHEKETYNTFIRPRPLRRKMPRYFLLRKFDWVALHGRLPFSRPLDTLKISRATNNELEEISAYLERQALNRPLSPLFQADSLKKKLEAWPGLEIEDFLIARDFQGRIVGCCAPWNADELQSMRVETYYGLMANWRRLLTTGSYLGLTRRLPRVGQNIRFCFLTHLFADNPDIFQSLLFRAWDETEKTQTLIYPHYDGQPMSLPPRSFIYTKTDYALYTVLPPNESLPDFLRPRLNTPAPHIELALL